MQKVLAVDTLPSIATSFDWAHSPSPIYKLYTGTWTALYYMMNERINEIKLKSL